MNLSDVFIGGAGANVTVLDDQIFDTSGTWAKPTGITYAPTDMALIELWGGGGGGARGGVITTGGAGGAYIRVVVPLSQLEMFEGVLVGAGGVGAYAWRDGTFNRRVEVTDGGDTSFAGIVAKGGLAGAGYDGGQAVYDYGLNGYALAPMTTLFQPGTGGWRSLAAPTRPGRKSQYGGSGGASLDNASVSSGPSIAQSGTAPGGGGGSCAFGDTTSTGSAQGLENRIGAGDGGAGRARIRIIRGLNSFEISEGPL